MTTNVFPDDDWCLESYTLESFGSFRVLAEFLLKCEECIANSPVFSEIGSYLWEVCRPIWLRLIEKLGRFAELELLLLMGVTPKKAPPPHCREVFVYVSILKDDALFRLAPVPFRSLCWSWSSAYLTFSGLVIVGFADWGGFLLIGSCGCFKIGKTYCFMSLGLKVM